MAIETLQADITTLTVDAIVNAANAQLRGGAGVCGAIFRAAGWDDLQAACEALGGCPTGDAVATPGFRLPARWVIHAVGPVWHGGGRGEPTLLASCYRRSLEVAVDLGARSVAFPAISTGVYGYPPEAAAEIAVATVRAFTGPVERVVLVAFSARDLARYQRLPPISEPSVLMTARCRQSSRRDASVRGRGVRSGGQPARRPRPESWRLFSMKSTRT
jgi:O-acetyl-ADP-ribose deacetylase (regulator of RNase III)